MLRAAPVGHLWRKILGIYLRYSMQRFEKLSCKYCSHTLDTPKTYQLPGGETTSSTFTRLFVSDAHQSLDDSLDKLESCGQQLAATRPVPFWDLARLWCFLSANPLIVSKDLPVEAGATVTTWSPLDRNSFKALLCYWNICRWLFSKPQFFPSVE